MESAISLTNSAACGVRREIEQEIVDGDSPIARTRGGAIIDV